MKTFRRIATLLQKQQELLGEKPIIDGHVMCFSPRLMESSKQNISELDEILVESYCERDQKEKEATRQVYDIRTYGRPPV